MTTIRNLTPHTVTLLDASGEVVQEYPVENPCPRVAVVETAAGEIAGAPIVRQQYGQVQDLPEEVAGTYLIVSALVQAAAPERRDLLIPAQLVRDEAGRIIGCRAFAAR